MRDTALPRRPAAKVGADPSPAAVRFARRLRELRERAFVRLTQDELGRLFGSGDARLSPATISMWENPASGRLPPEHRLETYARLFCTARSFEGGPHLIAPERLTEEERGLQRELHAELLELRAGAAAAEPVPARPPRTVWHFPDGAPITIVCGLLPDEELPKRARADDLNYVRTARFADLDTLIDVYGAVKASNPDSLVILTTGREMTRVDALNHLVLLGNTELNGVMRWFSRQLELPCSVEKNGVRADGRHFAYTVEDGELIEDIGIFVRGPHPSAPHRTLTICNGITTRGVRGAAQCFVNPTVRERNARFAERLFPEQSTYCVVMRVPVLNGEPLPQLLEEASNRLFTWSDKK